MKCGTLQALKNGLCVDCMDMMVPVVSRDLENEPEPEETNDLDERCSVYGCSRRRLPARSDCGTHYELVD